MELEPQFNWSRYLDLADYEQIFPTAAVDQSEMDWITQLRSKDMNFTRSEKGVLYGALVTWQNPVDKSDRRSICFYVTKEKLITIGLSDSIVSLVSPYSPAHPFAAFYTILALQLNTYFAGIDQFETELFSRQDELRGSINEDSLDSIFALRDTIENWSDLIVPFQELVMAGEESFLEEETYLEDISLKLAMKRVRRLLMLIEHYQKDIEVLLDLSTTVSNFRGNEIMKALTIFTAVATPTMALGAIWGMNFKIMPELDWKYGYALSLGLIFLSTSGIFYWMRWRGWLGALVRMPKNSRPKK